MSNESQGQSGGGKPTGGFLKWALWGVAMIGVAAVLYIIGMSATKPPPTQPAAVPVASESHDVARKLEHPADGVAPAAYTFFDAAGKPLTIADFKGKVVVMNLWASWCGPCKVEMPTLARLQRHYAGQPVVVVAISIDKPEALQAAKTFFADQAPLAFYNDPQAKLPWALKPAAAGMPTTLILGKDGLERGRVSGDADWSGPGARAVIDKALAS